MRGDSQRVSLLALDASVSETGWAVFSAGGQVTTGVIGLPGRRGISAATRIAYLVDTLDCLAERWQPVAVAHSQPSGIHWQVPALVLLDTALTEWFQRHRLSLYAYTAQEVRAAIAGHPNASKEELAYAVMGDLGLIGQGKTTHEWEAIAVGQFHLSLPDADGRTAAGGDIAVGHAPSA